MRIVMLLSNGFAPDPRVAAEALALKGAGHQVTIFAWDRTAELPLTEDYRGISIIRSHIQTAYSRGPLQIFKFMQFWRAAEKFLCQYPTDLVHCHDLDTLKPGLKFGRQNHIPVIFDAHESYPDMVAHLFPSWLVSIIRGMEAGMMPKTAAVITVGEILARHYQQLNAKNVVVVGNYKALPETVPVQPPASPPMKIIYVGGLNRDRLLGPMIRAVAGDLRYEFYIVGAGSEMAKFQELAGSSTNVVFCGYTPQEKARQMIEQCHLVFYAIDGVYANNQYSTPNLLFLALASARPVITTSVGEIAEIVRNHGCGTVLPDLEPETIRQALEKYFDGDFWRLQSDQSFRAAVTKYNWRVAQKNLLNIYGALEQKTWKNRN